jgi:putative AdoMet-dependent methyltransferase
MRSQYADDFNHDEDAGGYDADVADESNPIRAAYGAVLDWVIDQAAIGPRSRVLDLGSGTGNLSGRISACAELVCVDVSRQMNALAVDKLAHLDQVRFVEADLLEFFDGFEAVAEAGLFDTGLFDAVISTYAVHHLTEAEKAIFLAKVAACLRPGGRAVFGDLILEDETAAAAMLERYRDSGQDEVAVAIAEEFFWRLDATGAVLRDLGLEATVRRFSELSWGIAVAKPS